MKPFSFGMVATFLVWAALFGQSHEGPLFGNKDNPPKNSKAAEDDKGPEMEGPIKVNVNVVNVLASVRDKHNTLIPNLTKDDFEIYENGQVQAIKYFSRETNLPLTIGLLVDVSRSQENLIEIERRAASSFLNAVLRPKDEALLISFGADSELLCDITSSKKLMQRGLDDLKPNFGFSGINAGPVPTASHQTGTVLYDAIYLAASDRLAKEAGRKAIVVITDGDDEGSRQTIKQAIESAQRSDVTIYSIYYVDPYFYSRGGGFSFGGGGKNYLKQMSSETGGHVYEVDRKYTLDRVFEELQEEMRTQYAIGYSPTDSKKDGSYRKLEIRAKDKELKVQARKGYYATPGES